MSESKNTPEEFTKKMKQKYLDHFSQLTPDLKKACDRIGRLSAENKRLKEGISIILDHFTDTVNAGVVMTNTTPEGLQIMLKDLKGD